MKQDGEQGEESPAALGDPSSSTLHLEVLPAPKKAGVTHNDTIPFHFKLLLNTGACSMLAQVPSE